MTGAPAKPRLLVTDFHHLGDAVLAFPFLRAAQERFEVHICCRPPVRDVAALALPARQIHTWNPPWHEETTPQEKKSPSHQRNLLAHWREKNFSVAVSVWADPRAQLLWAKAGIPRRIGFPPTRLNLYASHLPGRAIRMRLSGWLSPFLRLLTAGLPLLTKKLRRDPSKPHQLQAWKKIALALDVPWSDSTPWIPGPSPARAPRAFDVARREGKKILLAHTGGRLPTKRWPLQSWASTLESLRNKLEGWQLFTFAGPGDPPAPQTRAIPSLPPPAAARELADLLQQADFVLAHDSFPAHLAHAVGTRALAIFGSGDPAWFAPGGDPANAVFVNECKWRPCLDVCRMPSQICLERLSPESVTQAVLARSGILPL